jgi:hypothetical protein
MVTKRQGAQILAPRHAHRLRPVGLGDHRIGESIGNPVLMDGNQACRPWPRRIAQPRHHPRRRQAQTAARQRPRLDQLAILRAPAIMSEDTRHSLSSPLPTGTIRPPSALARNTPSTFAGFDPSLPDQPRLIGVVVQIDLRQTAPESGRPRPRAGSPFFGMIRMRGLSSTPSSSGFA